jgi:AmmeMemoRadiSam system protein A
MAVVTLNEKEKEFLHQLVVTAITDKLEEKESPTHDFFSDTLKEEYGVFVTLKINGMLRGCIGYVEGIKPLQEAVTDMAISAAFKDPRFSPITKSELNDLQVEISVMSPLEEIRTPDEIVIGTHGLVIEKGVNRGLLLPQVATEYNWDRMTFLGHTCLKAGLPKDAWKDKETKILVFAANVF